MKLQNLLDLYPRVQLSNPAQQEDIFSLIDQTSISSESLQISFERKPDFFHFLNAQGHRAQVYRFLNKDGTAHGFAVSTFRKMNWNGEKICLGYTSDLRTTQSLDRDARLQWRKFYGHGVGDCQEIDEFDGCIGFITAVWNQNALAQKALVSKNPLKKRPNDFTYELTNTYQSYSLWGRTKRLSRPDSLVRPIRPSEVPQLISSLCKRNQLSWDEEDLIRTLSVFNKSFLDFFVLENQGNPTAFVIPISTSTFKKTIVKKWPFYLDLASKLLPLFGKKKVSLHSPIDITQLMLFTSITGDSDENLLAFVDFFWFENNQKPKDKQFSLLSINRWDRSTEKNFSLKKHGYLYTNIQGALYKVMTEKTSKQFSQINDFSNLEVGFL